MQVREQLATEAGVLLGPVEVPFRIAAIVILLLPGRLLVRARITIFGIRLFPILIFLLVPSASAPVIEPEVFRASASHVISSSVLLLIRARWLLLPTSAAFHHGEASVIRTMLLLAAFPFASLVVGAAFAPFCFLRRRTSSRLFACACFGRIQVPHRAEVIGELLKTR